MKRFSSHRAKTGQPAVVPDKNTAQTGQNAPEAAPGKTDAKTEAKELGGPEGPEPTRYGDWERKGICYDF